MSDIDLVESANSEYNFVLDIKYKLKDVLEQAIMSREGFSNETVAKRAEKVIKEKFDDSINLITELLFDKYNAKKKYYYERKKNETKGD